MKISGTKAATMFLLVAMAILALAPESMANWNNRYQNYHHHGWGWNHGNSGYGYGGGYNGYQHPSYGNYGGGYGRGGYGGGVGGWFANRFNHW